jgi:hypothetical protein
MLFPMKTSLFLCLALTALVPARGEIFRSEALRASHRGDGHRDHGRNHRTTVHVGVGVGHGYSHHHGSPWRHHHGGYGHRGHYYSPYRYVPAFGYYSGYGYGYPYYNDYGYYRTGNAASNGLLLGALAGGIIGHNSGELRHSAWRGAAWGAGIGWLLGSVADANRRAVVYNSAPVAVQQAPTIQTSTQSATPAQPQQVTIINNYYNSSPMSAANGLFGR